MNIIYLKNKVIMIKEYDGRAYNFVKKKAHAKLVFNEIDLYVTKAQIDSEKVNLKITRYVISCKITGAKIPNIYDTTIKGVAEKLLIQYPNIENQIIEARAIILKNLV